MALGLPLGPDAGLFFFVICKNCCFLLLLLLLLKGEASRKEEKGTLVKNGSRHHNRKLVRSFEMRWWGLFEEYPSSNDKMKGEKHLRSGGSSL